MSNSSTPLREITRDDYDISTSTLWLYYTKADQELTVIKKSETSHPILMHYSFLNVESQDTYTVWASAGSTKTEIQTALLKYLGFWIEEGFQTLYVTSQLLPRNAHQFNWYVKELFNRWAESRYYQTDVTLMDVISGLGDIGWRYCGQMEVPMRENVFNNFERFYVFQKRIQYK